MHARPLPIPGLPLAPSIHGLAVLEDVIHATSSHPRRPIAPLPISIWTAAPTIEQRPRPQAAAAPAIIAISPRTAPAPAAAPARATAHSPAPASSSAKPQRKEEPTTLLFPAHRTQQSNKKKSIPRFTPIQPEAFSYHRHPLAIRTPLDVIRFFPMSISAAAVLAGLSGLLAGKIVTHTFGGTTTPALFVAGYLALFLLCLLTHYFSSKGQLFFTCSHRFLRLLAVNALITSPHFIAYTILFGLTEK